MTTPAPNLRMRLAAVLAAILLPLGALTTTPQPPAHAEVQYDTIEVYKSGVCPPHVAPIWFFAAELLGAFAHPLVGIMLGPAYLILPYVGAIAGLAAFTVCTGTTTIDTLRFLIDEIERVSRTTVDETLAARLETYASGLGELILRREELIEAAINGELSERERNDLAAELTLIGNRASLALEQAAAMDWQSLLVVPVLAAIETQTYLLAARISPGSEQARRHLTELAAQARDAQVEIMRAKENRLRELLADAEIHGYRVKTTGFFKGDEDEPMARYVASYRIEAFAREGGSQWRFYDKLRTCEATPYQNPPWESPHHYPCEDFEERWQEYYHGAEAAYRSYRERLLSAIPPAYLAAKAAAGYYATYGSPGEAQRSFRLANNQRLSDTTYCVGIDGLVDAGPGSSLQVQPCNFDLSTPAGRSQVWDYLPSTAILRNVSTGLCVESSAIHASEGGELAVSLAPCPADPAAPTQSEHVGTIDRRAWGIHPAGYLVHLASGRCLDPRPDGGPYSPGVYGSDPARITQVSPIEASACRYDTASMRDGLDAPQQDVGPSSINDQVWNVRSATAPLTVAVPSGQGFKITSDVGDVDCRPGNTGRCQLELEVGTEVTLRADAEEAEADSSTDDVEWTGACAGTVGSTCSVVLGLDPNSNRVGATLATRAEDHPPLQDDDASPLAKTAISAQPVDQVYGQPASIEVAVSPAAPGSVSVRIGRLSIHSPVVDGIAQAVIPARALTPGRYRAWVQYSAAGPRAEVLRTRAPVVVARTAADVDAEVVEVTDGLWPSAVVGVSVGAEGDLTPRGPVTVDLAGRVARGRLGPNGTVRIRVGTSRTLRSGTLEVRYGGDRFVAGAVLRSTVMLRP